MNQKTEWGGAKIPGLVVSNPKGIAKEKIDLATKAEVLEMNNKNTNKGGRGQKRVVYLGDDTKGEM